MSYHVYVARPGFESSPISTDEWLAAASACPLLRIITTTNRKGIVHHSVRLASDPDRRIWRLPTGVIDAQEPTPEVIEALFSIAPKLGADVYSEKAKKYASVQDWESKTKSYRAQLAVARTKAHQVRRHERLRLLAKLATAAVVGAALSWLLRDAA